MTEKRDNDGNEHFEIGGLPPGQISFHVAEGREVIRLCPDGSIFVHGRLAETDKAVVDGMRALVAGAGLGRVRLLEEVADAARRLRESGECWRALMIMNSALSRPLAEALLRLDEVAAREPR